MKEYTEEIYLQNELKTAVNITNCIDIKILCY